MPLIPLRPLMEAAVKNGFAQGAFNVNAVAQAKAVIEVHEMFRSAAILQGADLANGFMGGRTDFANATLEDKKVGAKNIANAVKKYGANSEIPIVLHLDRSGWQQRKIRRLKSATKKKKRKPFRFVWRRLKKENWI